jgi:hypothetical protein
MMIKRDDPRFLEYILRLWKLMEYPRCMTLRAAQIVIDAAMFGIGCVEGEVRAKIAKGEHEIISG